MRLSDLWVVGFAFCLSGCAKHHEPAPVVAEEYNEIKVMTYNVLYTTPTDDTYKVLQQTDADIIGLQEASPSRVAELAQRLNFHFHSFGKSAGNLSDQDTGILSRFPITEFFNNGVIVKVNPQQRVALFTVHLSPYPYQPYDFRDGLINTPQEAVSAAGLERLPEINPVLDEIASLKARNIPIFLTGDFNEPSHLDWISSTSTKHFDKIVEWPVSKAVVSSGLSDVYRFQFGNPANFPGITWTTVESADEVYDRIDIIYYNNEPSIHVTDIRLVGGEGDQAGITIPDYSSDHYSVLATYSLHH